MTKTKKIIIFVVVVVVLFIAAWWIYNKDISSSTDSSSSGFSIRDFLPFGTAPEDNSNQNINSTTTISNTNNDSSIAGNVPIQKLRKLWDKPVASAVIFNRGTTSIVRFVEKATGNVYEAGSDSTQIKRLTHATLPKIMRGFWLPDGSGFLAQTIDDNETVVTSFIRLKLKTVAEDSIPYDVVISKLPTDIVELSVSPDGKKIFYYTTLSTAKGFVSNPDGTNPVQVYGNFLTEWIPTWFGGSSILLSSKASITTVSSGFFLNPNTKTLTRAYENVLGGTALSRADAKFLLLARGSDLWIKDMASSVTTPLNVKTLSEKCTWDKGDQKFVFCGVPKNLNDSNYPDSWYQGLSSTDDLVEKINVFDIYKYVLIDLNLESKEQIDTENLSSDSSGNFLTFQNKLDQSLWLLDTR